MNIQASLLAEELKRVEVEKNSVKNEYKFFLDSLSQVSNEITFNFFLFNNEEYFMISTQVLSNPCTDVTPTEESIRKRVKDLVVSEQERKNVIFLISVE